MNTWVPIKYMGFWDVPLIFVAPYKGELFLFHCEFDDELEDDSDVYKVYQLPADLQVDDLPRDWTKLHQHATRFLGEVPVSLVRFDSTHRRDVDATVLETLTTSANVQ